MNVVVTGCASGIGRRLAERLVERGDTVLATDIAPLEGLGCPTRRLDVRDPADWEAALDEAGEVDALLNVAGYLHAGWLVDTDPREVALTLDVNCRGVMLGTMAAARRMTARGSGHIVNIASMASLAPIPGLAIYSASKYAVRAFSLAAAQELRASGVAVTVVCPDAVQTPMLDKQIDVDAASLTFSGPRVLTVDDVTDAVLRALKTRPLLVAIPRGRAVLARMGDLFPGLAQRFDRSLRKKGLKAQRRRR